MKELFLIWVFSGLLSLKVASGFVKWHESIEGDWSGLKAKLCEEVAQL